MTSHTGKELEVCRYETTTPYPLGGQVVDCKVGKQASSKHEAGAGSRRTDMTTTNYYWAIDLSMKVKRFADFITAYAAITAEGTLPPFNLYVNDGGVKKGYPTCYVDKMTLDLDTEGVLVATFNIVSNGTIEAKDLTLTGVERTEAPMTKASITNLVIDAVELKTMFEKFSLKVDNHVDKVPSGIADVMGNIYPREATYMIEADYIRDGAAMGYIHGSDILADITIALTDNQTSPVTTGFGFTNAGLNVNSFESRALNIIHEHMAMDANILTIGTS